MSKPRGLLIAGNWKMNHSLKEAAAFFSALQKHPWKRSSSRKNEYWIIPSFVALSHARELAQRLPFTLFIAAQNAHGATHGAYTGEISGALLQDIGIQRCLLGHSERRQFFGETDASVRERLLGLIEQKFEVLFCVGETLAERKANLTESVLQRQLRVALAGISATPQSLRIAYEPVWAIGTGMTATVEQAQEAHRVIRAELSALFGEKIAQQTQVVYGGSVNPGNLASLLAAADVDGALIGGASLMADSFIQMIEIADRLLS